MPPLTVSKVDSGAKGLPTDNRTPPAPPPVGDMGPSVRTGRSSGSSIPGEWGGSVAELAAAEMAAATADERGTAMGRPRAGLRLGERMEGVPAPPLEGGSDSCSMMVGGRLDGP